MINSKKYAEELLVPGGAARTYELVRTGREESLPADNRFFYALLSSIKLAIRERAADQNLSTERSERSRHSAVSDVVSPAKYRHSKTRA